MDPDHPEPELLAHLVVEFRKHGQRSIEFLNTARELVETEITRSRRTPETVVYCLREALKALTDSQARGEGGEWKRVSRRVTDAAQRYRIAAVANLPGIGREAALAELLVAIEDLAQFHRSEGVHQKRLIAVIVDRTGAVPYASGTEMIREYQKLLGEIDDGLHGDVEAKSALEFYNRSVGLLRRLFLPPGDRNAELESLASLQEPSSNDAKRLRQLVVSPQNLQYFLQRLTAIRWLEVLSDDAFLDPPKTQGPWPGFAAAEALIPTEPRGVIDWLAGIYRRCRSSSTQAIYIFQAASDAGEPANPLLLRILRDHAESRGVRRLASVFLDGCQPAMKIVSEMADILLNRSDDDRWLLSRTAQCLIDGINDTNAIDRLELIGYKIKAVDPTGHGWHWFTMDASGTIASRDLQRPEDHFDVLLAAFVAGADRARGLRGTAAVLEVVDALPREVRERMRAWLLGTDPVVPIGDLVAEIVGAIELRDPTGDDLPMIDRVVDELETDGYQAAWAAALGPSPSIDQVGRALRNRELDGAWLRVYRWLGVLPEGVRGSWTDAFDLLCTEYGEPRRVVLEHPMQVEGGVGRSPLTLEELSSQAPIDAATRVGRWRPDPSEFLVGPRELARTLQATVEADPEPWLSHGYRIALALHEPIHISHFLLGIAKGLETATDISIDELMKVIELVYSHPWEPEAMGRSDWDFDPDWRQAEAAAVAALRALADHEMGFGEHEDRAWELIKAAVLNRTDSSGLPDESDPFTSAINRPCTCALEAAISFMGWEFRTRGAPRVAALELLEATLRLEGFEGAQHRSIIASRFGFFVTVTPQWLDDVGDLLFGDAAPEGLGQETIDLTLRWSRTSPWLMERFPAEVRDSVTRDVDHALDHFLIAHLWQLPRYSTSEVVAFLTRAPGLASRAGEALGRLAREADEAVVASAVHLWRAVLDAEGSKDLVGFGWFAEVEKLDDTEWADLTLRTMHASDGTIDWVHGVAERGGRIVPTTTTLAIFDSLVRHGELDWDRRHAAELAVRHIASAGPLADTSEYKRLHTTLSERGLL